MAPPDPIETHLAALDAPALRDLVRELAHRDPAVVRLLTLRAAGSTGDRSDPRATTTLTAAVSSALAVPGFVDYGRSADVARRAHELLDELAGHLEHGGADIVRPALRRATERLRAVLQDADDSAGVIGDAAQRAADLHARACREGHPDGRELARWLAGFRLDSPGWPVTELADHLGGLGADGLEVYRRHVIDADAAHTGDEFSRSEIDRMMLELADVDGDVDRAIDLLSRTGPAPRYGAVIDRLSSAGRTAEIMEWTDRAVADGRVSRQLWRQGPDVWLHPDVVAERYLQADREEDAIAVLRRSFRREAGWASYQRLLEFADSLGVRDRERTLAWEHARSRAGSHEQGALLVEIALGEDDLHSAWAAADEFGPGHRWRDLADASRDTMPRRAADLHRAHLADELRHADTRLYPGIAQELLRIRDLHRAAGAGPDFDAYLAGIRATYGRRPSLMKELDRAGLRGR